MIPAERIQKVILEFQLNNAEELARNINTDGDLIRNILTGRTKKMSGKVAKAIINKYPVSYFWLMTGDGEMIQTDNERRKSERLDKKSRTTDCSVCEEKERIIKILENQISELNDRIAEQKELIKYQAKYLGDLKSSEAREPDREGTGSK
jgi:uncharacterized protein YjgD (DUF1641 family)